MLKKQIEISTSNNLRGTKDAAIIAADEASAYHLIK
jgi:hypothetical protein